MSFAYILLALFVFGILIFIHELGHFLAARACGVGILEFSIGMGPKIFSKKSKKSGTLYSLRLLPIGGYVSMLGENGMEAVQGNNGEVKNEDEPIFINSTEDVVPNADAASTPAVDPEFEKHAYCNQSVWRRILISIAGPAMNVVLGFLLMFVIVFASGENAVASTRVGAFFVRYTAQTAEECGLQAGDYLSYVVIKGENGEEKRGAYSIDLLRQYAESSETGTLDVAILREDEKGNVEEILLRDVPLSEILATNALEQSLSSAQLQIGDTIKKVNSTRVHTYHELAYEVMNQGDRPISFTVERNGKTVTLDAVQIPTFVDPASNTVFGDMDFRVYPEDSFHLGTVIKHAWYRSLSTVKMVYDSLVGLFSGRYGVEAVSGPVGITKTISDVAKTGFMNVLYLVTVISINLGVMNLLPVPALDGGHLLLYLIEIIRRKPVKKEIEGMINFIGLVILLALAVIISIKDIIAL